MVPRLFSFSSESSSSSRIRERCCSISEGFYQVLQGSTRFCRVLRGSTGFYEVLQGSSGFNKALRVSARPSWLFPRTVAQILVQAIPCLERAAAHTPRLREFAFRKVLLVAAMQQVILG